MVLKRKKKREYYKELKTVRGVFDERTRLVLYRLLSKLEISAESLVKEGKESVILSGLTKNKKWVAIKVYRTMACDFKNIGRYLVGDPRFAKIKKNRRFIVNLWCQREFKNLKTAHRAGINCPKSIAYKENILIMSFIGESGIPAPRLIDVIPEKPEKVYEKVLKDMKKLAKIGLIHGDLSAYNILFLDKPFFIDFSHGTTGKNPIAPELLKRDVKNINSYFSKLNVGVKDSETLYKELIELIRDRTE